MAINKTQDGDKTVFVLHGRLDTTTAPELQEMLLPGIESVKRAELDFADIDYVSSAGLRVLLMGEKAAKTNGAKMTLINVSPEVMEVFKMTGFADMLTIL